MSYLKLARKQFRAEDDGGCPWWHEPRKYSRWEAWQDLIQSAAWRTHALMAGGTLVKIERGETPPRSIRFLAKRWNRSVKWVTGFLDLAVEIDRIRVQQSTREGHTYLIVNYESYQGQDTARGTDSDTPRGTVRSTARSTKQKKREEGEEEQTTPPYPPAGGNGAFPDWCRKVNLPQGFDRDSVLAMVIDSIEAITGRPPDPARCATDAKSLLSLWRAVGRPPPEEFARDVELVAMAARDCPDPLFARDVRAEGWPDGVDRHRSVATLAVHRRWNERLEAARRWQAQERGEREQKDPHSPARHGRPHWNGKWKWCSRVGDFVPSEDWAPLGDEQPGTREEVAH